MASLNWTDQSVADLINIADFIAKDSSKYAKITIGKIRIAGKKIRDFPMLGRIVPELNVTEIREIFIGNFKLIYFIASKERIDILSVYHSSRILNIQEIKKQTT